MNICRAFCRAILLIAICLSPHLTAQYDDIYFEHLTVQEGLPENSVFSMLQDHLGYLWLGTQNGLAKYDGHRMTIFQNDPQDSLSLNGRSVSVLHEDEYGDIWVGTYEGGLNHFHRKTNTFSRFEVPQYSSELMKMIKELQEAGSRVSAILEVGNNENRTEWFSIMEETTVLIIATGEYSRQKLLDYGWIENQAGKAIWEMDTKKLFWAGGQLQNKIQIALITLPAGKYCLRYKSNADHAYGAWSKVAPKPSSMESWGIQILAVKKDSGVQVILNGQQYRKSIQSNSISGIIDGDKRDEIWITSFDGGLSRLNPKTNSFIYYHADENDSTAVPSNFLNSLLIDDYGVIWIGADQGLIKFLPENERFTLYRSGQGLKPDEFHSFEVVYEDKARALWLGSRKGGLFKFDKSNETFHQYKRDSNNEFSLSNNLVRSIYEDNKGRLWVGTNRGLNIFDKQTEQFRRNSYDSNSLNGLSNNRIRAMLEDQTGVMWIGTWGGGLNKVDPRKQHFKYLRHDPASANSLSKNNVTAIYEDRIGNLWVGTRNNGLNKIKRQSGHNADPVFKHYFHNPNNSNSLSGNGIAVIHEDKTGILWIGTNKGLDKFDPVTEKFVRYQHDPDTPGSLSRGFVFSICEDRSGTFWIGTYGGGVNRYHPKENSFTNYSFGISNTPYMIYEDLVGKIWVATNLEGLQKFDPHSKQFTSYTFDEKGYVTVPGVYEDKSGRFWVSTYHRGIYLLDRESGEYTLLGEKEGLLSNTTWKILEDSGGHLWINTVKGISILDPREMQFKDFMIHDELQTIRPLTGYQSPHTGEMFWGIEKGVIMFHPDSIKENPHPPKIAITDFKLFNQPVGIGPDTPLKKDISVTDTVKLSHWQNDISLGFAALHFNDPLKNEYAYKLENYGANWRYSGHDREATYTNLDPGEYNFRVKAANSDGVWDETGKSLRIIITPPWWQTAWAYGIYIISFFGFLYSIRRFELNRQQKRIQLQESQKRARDAEDRARERAEMLTVVEQKNEELVRTQEQLIVQEKLASLGQLTAGIAHEIKNPLNFVNNFAELSVELLDELQEDIELNKAKLNGDSLVEIEEILQMLKNNVGKINEHGRRADGIVTGMLEHSRGKSGKFQEVDLNELLDEYINLAYHGMRARNEKFEAVIEREYDKGSNAISAVPQDLGRVFLNILNNGFEAVVEKFGQKSSGLPSIVKVSTKSLKNQTEIRIRDNGSGIPEDIRNQIFNPFFTTRPTGQGNTGLGLSICHDIVVKIHRGEIAVVTEPGEFTEFIIRLPKNSA